METWDQLTYGPLTIEIASKYIVRCGDSVISLGQAEFIVLLRLMACQGGAVSMDMLEFGLTSNAMLRLTICRLRKRLFKYLGQAVAIETSRQYGYRLSLSGEFFSFHM